MRSSTDTNMDHLISNKLINNAIRSFAHYLILSHKSHLSVIYGVHFFVFSKKHKSLLLTESRCKQYWILANVK